MICFESSCVWAKISLVSYPTRWSFSFILGPLHWSSSWQWQPSIAGCRLFQTLLWTQLADFAQFFCKMYLLYMWPSRKNCLVWFGWVLHPLKQPRKLTLGVLQNLLSNSVNSASLFYCLLDLAWASWLEQRTFKIYWVTQYILKMSPFDLRQHCRLTIWNNWLSRQIAVSVSDVKIQITLLILGRDALSNWSNHLCERSGAV